MILLKRAATAALLATGLFAATPSLAQGITIEKFVCFEGDANTCAIENSVFEYTNAFRAKNGLPALKSGRMMGYVARDWSRKQLSTGINHNGFPSARDQVMKAKFGAAAGQAFVMAENVAQNYMMSTDADATGKSIVEQWINSAGHRRNMLGNYKALGVGIAASGRTVIGTQIFGQEP